MSVSTLANEFGDLWRSNASMNDFLSRFVIETKSRAAGCWRLEQGHLKLVGFGWASDMPDDVSHGFQTATQSVSLKQTNLGIVRAVMTVRPTVAHRDPTLTGLDGSASWIVRFGANTSLAVPIREAKSGDIVGALAVSTAAYVQEGDSLWRTLQDLTSGIGQSASAQQ